MRPVALWMLPFVLTGCPTTTAVFVAAPALIYKSEFDEKRTAAKEQVDKGLISKEAGEGNCRQMLNNVDRNHSAPPPVDPAVCEFGSFADKRYELTKAVETGALTPELWVQQCQTLTSKPTSVEACTYDPLGERLVQWRRLVKELKASKEGAEMDCRNYVKQVRQTSTQPLSQREEACQL